MTACWHVVLLLFLIAILVLVVLIFMNTNPTTAASFDESLFCDLSGKDVLCVSVGADDVTVFGKDVSQTVPRFEDRFSFKQNGVKGEGLIREDSVVALVNDTRRQLSRTPIARFVLNIMSKT